MTAPTPTVGADQPTWLLDAQWPVFAGHFPSHPVLPGALLLDWVVSAITAQLGSPVESISQVKFPQAAEPGDCLSVVLRQDGTRVRFEVLATRAQGSHVVANGVTQVAEPANRPAL